MIDCQPIQHGSELRDKNGMTMSKNEPVTFAVSDCVYAPGLLCLCSDGVITYDPKATGPGAED